MSRRMRPLGFGVAAAHFGPKCALVATACLIASWSASARAQQVIVRPHQLHQHISGFGASSAWTAQTISDADADLLFSPDSGAGLSLLRVRIDPGGTTWELATAQAAQARGAGVWATSWSPPAAWKSNNNVNFGGTLLPEHADDWANELASFVTSTDAAGVHLFALSPQNEPTTGSVDGASCTSGNCISYEACRYTAPALGDFIANHLKPALTAAGAQVNVMGPEVQGWNDFSTYFSPFNALSASAVNVVATHDYNGNPASYPEITQSGRELWQTETSDPTPRDAAGNPMPDPGIESALRVAATINDALVVGNVSAWLYWWIKPGSDDNAGLFQHSVDAPTKRLYSMGNFSRFVRPGYFRVEVDPLVVPGFALSAFVDSAQDSSMRKLVLVAVNQNDNPVTQKLRFDGYQTGAWQGWLTSDAASLEPAAAIPDNGGGDFDYSFEPKSVTTLVGSTSGPGASISRTTSQTELPPEAGGCACSAAGSSPGPGAPALCLAAMLGLFSARRRRSA